MNLNKLNESIKRALNEEVLAHFGIDFDLPTGIVNAFYRGNIDIEQIYYRDDIHEAFSVLSDEELDDRFFDLFVDYTPEDEEQLSRREKELKLLEQKLYAAYEDSEREPDYREEDYTDRVDENFDISLFEYGIVRNPKDNSVIFGEAPNGDTGLYEDYSFDTISYEDVLDAIEEMEDGFFDFIDTPKEELLKELDSDHLAYYIMSMNNYNGKFHESVSLKKSNKFTLKEDENTDKLKEVEDAVRKEIEKIYADDEILRDYFYVESGVKKGHYDDGSDLYYVEVRGEIGYSGMVELAEKLDKIVQQYDEGAYFEQVTGGIMEAVIDFDRKDYVYPYIIVITDETGETVLHCDTLEYAEDLYNQISHSPKKADIIKLVMKKLDGEEYKVIKEFDQSSVKKSEEDINDLCAEFTGALRQGPDEFMKQILNALGDYDFDLCDRLVGVLNKEEQAKLSEYMNNYLDKLGK